MVKPHLFLAPDTPFLHDITAQHVLETLAGAGYSAYFVGGCVRNAILGVAITDIDIATDARPEQVMALGEQHQIRSVPTGIAHGTVTWVLDGQSFEITTFRRDVETDGRRAAIAFTNQVEEDARRRDFTMNALYADARGAIIDPMGGYEDACARRLRFIDDADARIREDYLRSLRFFRFAAQYAAPETGWDRDALDGIARNVVGLRALSKERITSELIKLLCASDPSEALCVMEQTGVLAQILPGAHSAGAAPVIAQELQLGLAADPMLRLAALGAENLPQYLRLPRAEQKRYAAILEGASSQYGPRALGFLFGAKGAKGALILRATALRELLSKTGLREIEIGAQAVFPLRACDFPQLSGAELGTQLKALKLRWLDEELLPTKEMLLGQR